MRAWITAIALTLALCASTRRAFAGPEDIPPPSPEAFLPQPPRAPIDTPSMHAPTERFHVEAEFLHARYADVSLPLEDYAAHRGPDGTRGYALGASAAVSFRFTTSFHLGLAVRYQHIFDRARESLDAHLVAIPVCFTWIWPIHADAWFSYGFGIGTARVKFDPPDRRLASNTGSSGYLEQRVAFARSGCSRRSMALPR